MKIYDIVLPEGFVLLKDRETGEMLRLSAENGPLTLGTVTMSPDFSPSMLAVRTAEARGEVRPPKSDDLDCALNFAVPPGFGSAETAPCGAQMPGRAPENFMRVLDAPLEALAASDFEATLESLANRQSILEREIDFMREIDGDPDDIAEMERKFETLAEKFGKASERFNVWKAAQAKKDYL